MLKLLIVVQLLSYPHCMCRELFFRGKQGDYKPQALHSIACRCTSAGVTPAMGFGVGRGGRVHGLITLAQETASACLAPVGMARNCVVGFDQLDKVAT